jgi:hypothetical protein
MYLPLLEKPECKVKSVARLQRVSETDQHHVQAPGFEFKPLIGAKQDLLLVRHACRPSRIDDGLVQLDFLRHLSPDLKQNIFNRSVQQGEVNGAIQARLPWSSPGSARNWRSGRAGTAGEQV